MTRLPGPTQKETKQTWDESRKIEASFFKKGPWTAALEKQRLGMTHLTEALSVALARMIEDMYPLSCSSTHKSLQAAQFEKSTRCKDQRRATATRCSPTLIF